LNLALFLWKVWFNILTDNSIAKTILADSPAPPKICKNFNSSFETTFKLWRFKWGKNVIYKNPQKAACLDKICFIDYNNNQKKEILWNQC
jgi:hypothetical protein